jgi:hypothetical protein
MGKGKSGNGDSTPKADKSKLSRILGKAKSEKTEQAAFKRTHDARERARQARVRQQRDNDE